MAVILLLQFIKLAGKRTVGASQLAHLHKGPHYGDVYLNSTIIVENAGEHGNTLLGEGKDIRRMFESGTYHNL